MTPSNQRPAPAPTLRLEMSVVDADGQVLAVASEPFAVGRFDLAAARQGMRKILAALEAEPDDYL